MISLLNLSIAEARVIVAALVTHAHSHHGRESQLAGDLASVVDQQIDDVLRTRPPEPLP